MLSSPPSYLTASGHPIILSQQQYYCIDHDPDPKATQCPAEVLSTPTARPLRRFSPEAGLLVKKVNHSATERDRRKKINSLISSLRSLLPPAEQTKKLSIPATISRVLKYIPELQAQIQLLTQEKQRLLSCASDDRGCCSINTEQRRDDPRDPRMIAGLTVESTCWRSEREAVIQICQGSHSDKGISEVLLDLEGNGFSLTSASGFKSCGGNFLHNLHVWVGEDSRSPQDGQNIAFHGESLDLFDSKYLWPTIIGSSSNLDLSDWKA